MCDSIAEQAKATKVYEDIKIHMESYTEDVGLFRDDKDNWYVAKIDDDFKPISLWSGSTDMIRDCFNRFLLESEMCLEGLVEHPTKILGVGK